MTTAAAIATITPADGAAFDRDGYLIKRGLFGDAEVGLLQQALATDEALQSSAFGLDDGYGGQTTVAVWNHPGDDTLGIVPRLRRVGGAVATLLGGEVYHYHSKITSKAPGGGTWDWHQDYGYWYKNGVLFPNLATVAIAVSELTEANGTMRVLRGSHLCGRLEHSVMGGQNGADVSRVAVLQEHLEEVSFVAEPGDACFFHCNMLHTSAPNMSDRNRDLLLCAYNRADNNPTIKHHHPPSHRWRWSTTAPSCGRACGVSASIARSWTRPMTSVSGSSSPTRSADTARSAAAPLTLPADSLLRPAQILWVGQRPRPQPRADAGPLPAERLRSGRGPLGSRS